MLSEILPLGKTRIFFLHSRHSILQIVTGSREVNIILGFTRDDILISDTLRK